MSTNLQWGASIVEAYNKIKNQSRIISVFPDVRERLHTQGARTLLDLGCGDGTFLSSLTSEVEAKGYDISEKMQETAKKMCRGLPNVKIVNKLQPWKKHFDAITCIAVHMHWKTTDECVDNLALMQERLKPDGTIYHVVTHPCFHHLSFSDFTQNLLLEDYSKPGAPYKVTITGNINTVVFEDYHWSLHEMSKQIKESGLRISIMHEYPDTRPAAGIPWLLFELKHQ